MKRSRISVLFLVVVLLLGGCGLLSEKQEEAGTGQDSFSDTLFSYRRESNKNFTRAVWVSYLDIVPLMAENQAQFENNIETMFKDLATISTTDVYFQVRAFGDSFYPSSVYPSANETIYNMSSEFDYFKIVVDKAHAHNMELHAWINPYRLHASTSEIYQVFIDGLTNQDYESVQRTADGRTLNPASAVAQQLVLDGVQELVDNYAIDGIHLDDYFYPTTEPFIDEIEYQAYAEGGGTDSLEVWRRGNVTKLVKGIYDIAKAKRETIQVGIAPDASIDRDMQNHYVDVKLFCQTTGYIDYICPQIYFGYQNETMPFLQTVSDWAALATNCQLIVGLSFYKVGTTDANAGAGSNEWLENDDIISRQYLDSLAVTNCAGVAFYRYSSIFNPDAAMFAQAQRERENLQQII